MSGLLSLILITQLFVSGGDVGEINDVKIKAQKAFQSGDYETAIAQYSFLLDTLHVEDENARLNLAHAYFKLEKKEEARTNYSPLLGANNLQVRSVAAQQLGLLAFGKQKYKDALDFFKQSLRANPGNEDARFNYEMVSSMLNNEKNKNDKKDEDIEPSEFAKQVKKKADELIGQGKFKEAFSIYQQGLSMDKTVKAYNDIISRVQEIAQID